VRSAPVLALVRRVALRGRTPLSVIVHSERVRASSRPRTASPSAVATIQSRVPPDRPNKYRASFPRPVVAVRALRAPQRRRIRRRRGASRARWNLDESRAPVAAHRPLSRRTRGRASMSSLSVEPILRAVVHSQNEHESRCPDAPGHSDSPVSDETNQTTSDAKPNKSPTQLPIHASPASSFVSRARSRDDSIAPLSDVPLFLASGVGVGVGEFSPASSVDPFADPRRPHAASEKLARRKCRCTSSRSSHPKASPRRRVAS
jgi:hypothetical protein